MPTCAHMINLSGKRAVIFGVASEESIAWAIAKSLLRQAQPFVWAISGDSSHASCSSSGARKSKLNITNVVMSLPKKNSQHSLKGYQSPWISWSTLSPLQTQRPFRSAFTEVSKDHFAEALVASSYSLLASLWFATAGHTLRQTPQS